MAAHLIGWMVVGALIGVAHKFLSWGKRMDEEDHYHCCPDCGHVWSHNRDKITDRNAAHKCAMCGQEDWYRKDTEAEALAEQKEVRAKNPKVAAASERVKTPDFHAVQKEIRGFVADLVNENGHKLPPPAVVVDKCLERFPHIPKGELEAAIITAALIHMADTA